MPEIVDGTSPEGGVPSALGAGPVPVLINRDGGTIAGASDGMEQQIRDAFGAVGREAAVEMLAPDALSAAVERLSDQPLIVVGGGDGTLGSIAGQFALSKATLAILPLGTRNHLALQLGIPGDIAGAVDVIVNGRERAIDLGSVNEMTFVNNASIGFYPLMVRWRDEERRRHGLPKGIANLVAAWGVLRRLRHHNLRLTLDGVEQTIRTPLLFVGNNRYSLEAGHIGERAALDDGELSVLAVATRTRASALWFAARAMIGRADPEADFAVQGTCRELQVSAHSGDVNVALDGELHRLRSPLRFAIRRGALRVMASKETKETG